MKFPFFTAVLLAAAYGGHAFAAEPLLFGHPPGLQESRMIGDFYKDQKMSPPLPADIARTDLNGDGIDEYVIRQAGCLPDAVCAFDVLAESEKRIISLGTIRAGGLMATDQKVGHVRSLMAVGTALNDYAAQIYAWTPEKRVYSRTE